MAKGPRPLIAGNWKMNGLARPGAREVNALASRFARLKRAPAFDLVICPPATLIIPFRDEIKRLDAARRIALGGQDCHVAESGAHTGDISAKMLKDAGCRYTIVGHSERRASPGETDARVRAKAEAAQAAGLTAIICIGEVRQEREAGQTLRVLTGQLAGSVPRGATALNTVIAYEPVWAIGTGLTPSPDDVARAHAHVRERLAVRFDDSDRIRIIYGGSVKAANAVKLLSVANVDGALVGGASLKAKDFWPIAMAVQPA